jgi:hypothetical protein
MKEKEGRGGERKEGRWRSFHTIKCYAHVSYFNNSARVCLRGERIRIVEHKG